jgi:hypothetical protein
MGSAAARFRVIDLRDDHLLHAIYVAEHFVIPETYDPITLAAHEIISMRIICSRLCMLAAIDVDDEHRFQAGEKSAMYGPMRTWRRNLWPSSCRMRR